MNGRSDSDQQEIILDSITEGVFAVDHEFRITSFNRAAEQITGVPREQALGQRCKDILRADICEGGCLLAQTVQTGKPIVNRTVTIVDSDGRRKPITVTTALLRDADGRVMGGVETFRDVSQIEQLRKELNQRYELADIVSRNHRIRKLFDILPEVSASTCTVLIQGETGTGKELFARAIHTLSGRRPFVAVNCGALPDTLLESELFGYKAGAFTDARKDKPGRFALAEGGTLFLDEIGDVSGAMQVRLLRFLQERVYEPLGSVEPVTGDVRVVTATNRDLEELVAEGSFRQDLYYRINVVRLEIPPLRERLEDVPLLVPHFVDRFNALQGKSIGGVTDEAQSRLVAYHFPGNVRELENIIERAFVLCRGPLIGIEHLPEAVAGEDSRAPASGDGSAGGQEIAATAEREVFRRMEADLLMDALRRHGWNRTHTAAALGMHKTTLHRKIRALGLDPPLR